MAETDDGTLLAAAGERVRVELTALVQRLDDVPVVIIADAFAQTGAIMLVNIIGPTAVAVRLREIAAAIDAKVVVTPLAAH